MINIPDDWIPKVGEKIWIKEFFYAGIDEFRVSEIINTRFIKCIHDGVEYNVDLNYYKPDIFTN